jgi:hypothetical protein
MASHAITTQGHEKRLNKADAKMPNSVASCCSFRFAFAGTRGHDKCTPVRDQCVRLPYCLDSCSTRHPVVEPWKKMFVLARRVVRFGIPALPRT